MSGGSDRPQVSSEVGGPMTLFRIVAILCFTLASVVASAEEAAAWKSAHVGSKFRITTNDGKEFAGEVTAADETAVKLSTDGKLVNIPSASIKSVVAEAPPATPAPLKGHSTEGFQNLKWGMT